MTFLKKLKMVFFTILLKIKKGNKIEINGVINLSYKTKVTIHTGGKISFGKRTKTSDFVDLAAVAGGQLIIEERVGINTNCIFTARNRIVIGDNCIFGPNVVIFDHNHIFDNEHIDLNHYTTGEIIIEKNCWIGSNVTILRNTHIGEGCVIAAGAIIKGNIPPHSLVSSDRTLKIEPIREKK